MTDVGPEFTLERTQAVPVPVDEAFAFFAEPLNLEAITPPWLRFRIVAAPERLERRSILRYTLRVFGWPIRWTTEITDWHPPRSFVDLQVKGPYPLWEHTHRLTSLAARETEIHDHIRYRVPGGPLLARAANGLVVRRWLDEIFDFRAARMRELLR